MERAFSDTQKNARRRAIVAAASGLFVARDYAEISMADVARASGIAKGTVYLYFPTKETLFAAIVGDETERWFRHMEATLGALDSGTPEAVAEVVTASFQDFPQLGRLLAIVHTILERNMPPEILLEAKRRYAQGLHRTGILLERVLPALPPGAGISVLRGIATVVRGLPLAAPLPPAVRDLVASDPALACFATDPWQDMRQIVTALLRGFGRSA